MAFFQAFLISIGVKIAGGIGRVHLVNQRYLAVVKAKLILGVYQYQPMLIGYLLAAFEHLECFFADFSPNFFLNNSVLQNFLLRDIFIMTFLSFSGRREDRLFKFLVLHHAIGELYPAKFPLARIIDSPGVSCKAGTNNDLNRHGITFFSDCDVGMGHIQHVCFYQVLYLLKPKRRQLIQDLSLEGDSLIHNVIESGNAIAHHNAQRLLIKVIHVAYLAVVGAGQTFNVGFCNAMFQCFSS